MSYSCVYLKLPALGLHIVVLGKRFLVNLLEWEKEGKIPHRERQR